jgi:hypothetical protein
VQEHAPKLLQVKPSVFRDDVEHVKQRIELPFIMDDADLSKGHRKSGT